MSDRSGVIGKWWPTTQSLDLIDGPAEHVAAAVDNEVRRFLKGGPVSGRWATVEDLDAAFSIPSVFANVPTYYLVLPTHSRWTVLWNNSFLCDGYDSLCFALTANHGLTSLHWFAHDEWTTMQSGAGFTHRRREGTGVVERSVYCAQEDTRWHFHATGTPLAEESLEQYSAARKRDRLNEASMQALLRRLDADPWNDGFYAVPERPIFVLERLDIPPGVTVRSRAEVLTIGDSSQRGGRSAS
jgi:hypothetical protein